MSGSRSTSTATSASANTSPGRTKISTGPCSSGRRSMTSSPATPTRSCSPTVARPGIPRPVRSKAFSTQRPISPDLEHNKRFLQYAPPGSANVGLTDEPAIFTAGTIATCWEWAALGPQMLNQKIPGEPGEVADPAKPVTPDMVLIVPPPGFPSGGRHAEPRLHPRWPALGSERVQ